MPLLLGLLLGLVLGQGPDNPLFDEVVAKGLTVNETTVRLPSPMFPDGQDPEAARLAMKTLVGDDRAVREFLRDSITAPFVLKTRDTPAGDAVIRSVDLWFAIRAELPDFDVATLLRESDGKAVEVGNMRFETKVLTDQDLRDRKVTPLAPLPDRREWYARMSSRLLDRLDIESTSRAVLTRSPGSIRVATRTDPAFPNRWSTLNPKGVAVEPSHPYGGGIGTIQVGKLAGEPGLLLVEAHFAFIEPQAWFQGNPILRSKFGVIAQDQVRRLRREVAAKRSK